MTTHPHPLKGARKLGTVGDVNPIEYGGGYILSRSGDGSPWVEYFEGIEDMEDQPWGKAWEFDDTNPAHLAAKVRLYRVDLEANGEAFMSRLDWIDLDSVASACGLDSEDFKIGKRATATQRACFAWDVASYYGWHELDHYPLELTLGELIARWERF